jgi:hypothetical protein
VRWRRGCWCAQTLELEGESKDLYALLDALILSGGSEGGALPMMKVCSFSQIAKRRLG